MQLAPRRVRWRLSWYYAISLTLIFSVFSVCVFLFVRISCMIPIHAQLDQELALVAKAVRSNAAALAQLETEDIVPYFRISQLAPSAAAGTATTLYTSRRWNMSRFAGNARVTENGNWLLSATGRHYFGRRFIWSQAGITWHIDVAVDTEQSYVSVKKLTIALLLSWPLVLLASLGGGYFFAARVLAPIGAMADKAREITADKLSERLPVQDPNDEFGHLATVFNETVERLDTYFERLRRFTADASHELRTPLAVIRCVGENALQQTASSAQYENAIGSMLEETDSLMRLLDGLLMLTRAEAGQLALQPEPIDLAALALDVVNCLRVLAEEKHQQLCFDGASPGYVMADRATIRQALINLLANAIRYTPEHGDIGVRLVQSSAGMQVIEIRDNGPGIAAEHQSKIFERFYRIDQDRSRETGGAGLGLAIARWMITLNSGSIALESKKNKGSIFRVTLAGIGLSGT